MLITCAESAPHITTRKRMYFTWSARDESQYAVCGRIDGTSDGSARAPEHSERCRSRPRVRRPRKPRKSPVVDAVPPRGSSDAARVRSPETSGKCQEKGLPREHAGIR